MIKPICIHLLCLLCVFCSNAGYSQSLKPSQKDSLIKAMLNVGDLVKIDGKACMIDKSFLSDIAGYKDLFPVPNDLLVCYMMENLKMKQERKI